MLRSFASVFALTAVTTIQLASSPADACGGCFVPPTESTVVTGHRMALSISPDQAVLWDQIRYSGDPADFSWVLPVKEGARVEIANDAFFEALDAATATTVQAPPEGCRSNGGGFGCGASREFAAEDASMGGPGGGVQVLHKGTVGPYDTVTLASTDPNALESWLTENGYTIPDSIKSTLAAYVTEGFDFIALKLQPNQGVQQMKPVRVVSSSMQYALPLRMVAAGVGAEVEIVLYVIGEGRYEASNFENTLLPPALVTWDFKTDQSDYAELRLAALGKNDGRTWLTSYALSDSLLAPVADPIGFGGFLFYNVGADPSGFGQGADTIVEAYFRQGLANQEGSPTEECIATVESFAGNIGKVVDLCDENGENCVVPAADQIDARQLACDTLDDFAIAMTGLHPSDIVLTRLEANLPVAALSEDLSLAASDDQGSVQNRFNAGLKLNACWDSEPAAASIGGSNGGNSTTLVLFVLGAAGLYFANRRRTAL